MREFSRQMINVPICVDSMELALLVELLEHLFTLSICSRNLYVPLVNQFYFNSSFKGPCWTKMADYLGILAIIVFYLLILAVGIWAGRKVVPRHKTGFKQLIYLD